MIPRRPVALPIIVAFTLTLASTRASAADPPRSPPSPASDSPSPSTTDASSPPSDSPSPEATIVVLASPEDPLGLRLQAELLALGFHPILEAPAEQPPTKASLEAVARKRAAVAAIRAVPSSTGVEVWIAERATGKTVIRKVDSPSSADPADRDASLALGAVDLLRASLLEVSLKTPLSGEVPPTPALTDKLSLPAPRSLTPSAPATLRFSLALGGLWSPGSGPMGSLEIGAAWLPSSHVGAAAFASIPLSRTIAHRHGASVDLSVFMMGLGVRFVPTSPTSRWAPSADLGVMAILAESHGTPAPGDIGRDTSAAFASPFVRAGLAYAATPMLRARVDLLAGLLVQAVSVRIENYEVMRFGQPSLFGAAGVDFGWF